MPILPPNGFTAEVREVLTQHGLSPHLATPRFVELVYSLSAKHLMDSAQVARLNAMRSTVVFLAEEVRSRRIKL